MLTRWDLISPVRWNEKMTHSPFTINPRTSSLDRLTSQDKKMPPGTTTVWLQLFQDLVLSVAIAGQYFMITKSDDK